MDRSVSIVSKIASFVTAFIVALSAFTMSTEQAYASAAQCSSLQRQLASATRGGSSGWAKYDAAATKQSTEIWYIKRDIRRGNCRSSNSGKCRSLKSTLSRMNANYKALIRKRESFRNSKGGRKARAIERKMAALNCSGKKRKSLVVNRNAKRNTQKVPSGQRLGGYRTMCVRTCDGYYFPVSHASTKSDFKRDEAICNAMCPATESKLFVHRNADQESEDMVSLKGEAYTALPTAFRYRTVGRSPSCSCGAADLESVGLQKEGVIAKKEKAQKADPLLAKLPAPGKRPDLYGDPETQAQVESDMTAKTVLRFVGTQGEDELLANAQSRNIRVVGAEFLPDPATAIDLQAPAPKRVQ